MRKNSAARAVTRDFERRTKRALRAMSRASLTERRVHDVRKRLKDARASLRLMRRALGSSNYRKANRGLRDAARPFAAARDAMVLEQTFRSLAERLGSETHAALLRAVERALARERQRVRRLSAGGHAWRGSRKLVRQARKRAIGSSKEMEGWKVVGAGLRCVYRNGREALHGARDLPSVERLHEWRKQAKYLRHGLEVLWADRHGRQGEHRKGPHDGGSRAPGHARREDDLPALAHRLTDLLGEDHDLAMLGIKLVTLPMHPALQRRAVRLLEPRILARRTALQRRAFDLGRRLYAPAPADFERYVRASTAFSV